ncbi:MAG: HPr family phosphocarrier protein [Oceanospirillaceae bacterium]
MPRANIEIINKLGLHARAASKLVAITSKYSCDVKITKGEKIVDGKSIMSVMMLAASKGTQLQIATQGEDQDQALEAIVYLINNRFDEEE